MKTVKAEHMKAVVITKTCRAHDLEITNVPIPEVRSGWVLVKVKAFGINRAEVIFRNYEADAPYITLPRIPGIECSGEVEDPSDSRFKKGRRVVALMGGMGRSFDGSYAEYILVPEQNVFTADSDLSWAELGAIPETYYTAYGSLFQCLQIKSSDVLLVRGGTSSAGLASIQLAKSSGCRVAATTRKIEKEKLLKEQGADHVLIENGSVGDQLRAIYPGGVSKILEFIGPATLKDSLSCLSPHGIVCVTGILGKQGTLDNFDPIKDIPNGVYLTSFFSNFPVQADIDEIFGRIEKYALKPRIAKVFPLKDIGYAHEMMESNTANGKIVVTVD